MGYCDKDSTYLGVAEADSRNPWTLSPAGPGAVPGSTPNSVLEPLGKYDPIKHRIKFHIPEGSLTSPVAPFCLVKNKRPIFIPYPAPLSLPATGSRHQRLPLSSEDNNERERSLLDVLMTTSANSSDSDSCRC